MKKLLLLSVMALVGLTANAQFSPKSSTAQKTNPMVLNVPQSQRSFQAVAPRQERAVSMGHIGKQLQLDVNKLQPVARTMGQKSMVLQGKAARANKMVSNRRMTNLQPTMTLSAPQKAGAFRPPYTGKGTDYFEKEDVTWTMTPATVTDEEEQTSLDVLVDVIPALDVLSNLYPEGIPVTYTQEDNIITIQPQAVANYSNETNDTIFYITLCSVNSDEEDGSITMELGEDGMLKVVDGNWIAYCVFADVEFDEDFADGEAYQGMYSLITYVRYIHDGQKDGITVEKEYDGYGIDMSESMGVTWTMEQGTYTEDGEDTPIFVNMSPFDDMFAGIYPDGIYVEYEQNGSTITVQPQQLATVTNDDNTRSYILLFSGKDDNGIIKLTVGSDGSLNTVQDEEIMIAAWTTKDFDPTYETYEGYYTYTSKVKYLLPGTPAPAPESVACEALDLVLFAGLGYSGYGYNDNLAIMGAYAPTTFRNGTLDMATSFEWSVLQTDDEGVESTITSNDKDLTLNTKAGYTYEEFTLTGYNQDAASDPYTWGYGHCPNSEGDGLRYEAVHLYAGEGASSFEFTDGSYATMTRQNPDGDLTFYTNWGTPDIYTSNSISTIYSYQGKPSTPLFITGVTLPMVSFEAKEDFNLHIKLLKCTRSATGRLTLGDVIAEADATSENINADYDAGLTAVEFTELYVEDEFGMSEVLDYLFIEDEFIIVIEGWDNGTFSGVLGSQDITDGQMTSTWFGRTGYGDEMRYYTSWFPQLFIGLLDATYGYLHTEDNTNLAFGEEGGQATIHVDPMYYGIDEETEEPTYSLRIESIFEDGEEAEEIPEWLTFEIANEDYTTATATTEGGEEYEYFVNGIDYDMIVTAEALPESVESREVEVTFFQRGAKLTVKASQAKGQGIQTTITKQPVKNSRIYNMAGQPVKAAKGIVLRDGKKVVLK